MKIKKIFLFILLFLAFLFISNNVNAYVINEGGVGKYYLPDLPFDDSGEVYTSVLFHDETNGAIICVEIPNAYSLGYDTYRNTLKLICDIDDVSREIFYYTCSVTQTEGLYIAETWSSQSAETLNLSSFKCIGGTGFVYPYNSSSNILYKTLPEGVNWGDDFWILDTRCCVPEIQYKNGAYVMMNSAKFKYYPSLENTNAVTYSVYNYDTTTKTWVYSTKTTEISNFIHYACLYRIKDVYSTDRSSIYGYGTDRYFWLLYGYKVFPYILNSQEDLAKGEEDIIIMPRRFY